MCNTEGLDGDPMVRQSGKGQFNGILAGIERSLKEIDSKLTLLIKTQSPRSSSSGSSPGIALDVETLLSLPDHLRKSAMTLSEFGEATAQQVARKTGRTRAAESDYLNQLVRLGLVTKRRKGRDVYFGPGA